MITLKVLGGVALESDGTPLTGRVVQRRRLALLSVLAAAPARGVSRDRLVALLWPETRDEQARALLSDSLYVVRKALGEDALLAFGDDLRLNAGRVHTDLVVFEGALDTGEAERAVAAYSGPFLDGVHVGNAPEFERWASEVRDRLQRRYARALEEAAASCEQRADHAGAVEHLRTLVALDPGAAGVTVRLMCSLAGAGNVPAALQAARVHAALMREEFGRGPDAEVAALAERLRSEPAPREAAPREAIEALHLGPAVLTGAAHAAPASTADDAPLGRGARPVSSNAWPEVVGAEDHVPARPRHSRPAATGATLAVAALLMVILLATSSRSSPRGRPTAHRDTASGEAVRVRAGDGPMRVAVLPFAVRGGQRSAYLRDAVASLLAAKLDGAGPWRSLDPNLVLARAGAQPQPLDPRAAATLGGALGADYVVLGDAVDAGGRLQLTAAMLPTHFGAGEPTPMPVARAVAEDVSDGVFRAVDTLTLHLLSAQQASAGQELASAAALTTGALSALKAYLEGEAAYREGKYEDAVEAFETATRLDSNFALAYARIVAATRWAAAERGPPALERATHHAARLPPRYRAIVDVEAAKRRGEVDEAERLARSAVDRYPEDPEHWIQLGELLQHSNEHRGRSNAEARVPFERAVVLLHDSRAGEPLYHLIQRAAHDGDRPALDSLARRLLAEQPRGELSPIVRVARAVGLNDRSELARLRDLFRSSSTMPALNAVTWTAGVVPDLREISPLLGVLTDSARTPAERAVCLTTRAFVEAGRGRWGTARAAVAELAALDSNRAAVIRAALYALVPYAPASIAERRAARDAVAAVFAAAHDSRRDTISFFGNRTRARYTLGVLESTLGHYDAALGQADWIERAARRAPHLWEATYAGALRARVLADRGEWAAALSELARRYPDPVADSRVLHAELLERVGRDAEALRWYASSEGGQGTGVIRMAPVHLRMAEILARRGDRRAAAFHLDIAAARWNDADPELKALIASARARIGSDSPLPRAP